MNNAESLIRRLVSRSGGSEGTRPKRPGQPSWLAKFSGRDRLLFTHVMALHRHPVPCNSRCTSAGPPLAWSCSPFDSLATEEWMQFCPLPSLATSAGVVAMEADSDIDTGRNNAELQRRILQNTLQEVAARDENDLDCCVICLDAITDPVEASPCGHRNFDYLCALSWFLEHPSCPLCKANVTSLLRGPADAPNREATAIEQKPEKRPSSHGPHSRSVDELGYRNRRRERLQRHHRSENRCEVSLSQALERRRNIYRQSLYSKHVGSNRVSRYQELTPQLFCADEELVSRARLWIRRELQVFSFLSLDDAADTRDRPGTERHQTATERRRANNAEFLLEYIVAVLKSVDIMGSAGQAEDMISDFLGRDNTKLFLHELRAWLRSPFTKLEDWDRAVQYDEACGSRQDGTSREANRTKLRGDFYRPSPSRSRQRDRHEPYRRNEKGRRFQKRS